MGVRVDDVLELRARGEDGFDGLRQPRAGGKLVLAIDEKSWARQPEQLRRHTHTLSRSERALCDYAVIYSGVHFSLEHHSSSSATRNGMHHTLKRVRHVVLKIVKIWEGEAPAGPVVGV